jgi:hypothetical protein
LHRQAKSTVRIKNTDGQAMLSDLFNSITHATDQSERNDLYRIIIDRIIWSQNGDDIKVTINSNEQDVISSCIFRFFLLYKIITRFYTICVNGQPKHDILHLE